MKSKIDSMQSFLAEAQKRLGFSVDLMSFIRQSWFVQAGGLIGSSFNAFAATSGVLMSISASLLIKRAFETMAKAIEESDPKTFLLHTFTSLPSAVSYATIGFGFTISNIAALAGKIGIASSVGSIIPGSAMAMSAANLLSGLYGEYTTGKLKDDLDRILQEGDPIVYEKIKEIIKTDDLLIIANARQKCAIQMILDRISKSPREFERQTSPECLKEVQKLMKGKSVECLTGEEQKQILRLVYETNYRTNLKGRLLMAVSIIGIVACITSMVLTGGVGAALIFIVGALVWMALDSPEVSKRIGDWFWAHRKTAILSKDLQEDGDASPDSEVKFLGKNALAVLFAPLWMIPSSIYFGIEDIYERFSSSSEDDDDLLMSGFAFTNGKLPPDFADFT